MPRTSDGQLLFLQHLIQKWKKGSRIGIVFNGSPMYCRCREENPRLENR